VGGGFTTLGGQTRIGLGRLNPDGSLDSSFNLNANGSVQTMALQANGKILVGGEFTTLGGQSRSRLARLNADGTLDASFPAGANNTVYSLALQEDGRVLVGGDFTLLGGQNRTRAGRLANPDAPTQSVTFDCATLTWLRGGSLTEAWRTEAEADAMRWHGRTWNERRLLEIQILEGDLSAYQKDHAQCTTEGQSDAAAVLRTSHHVPLAYGGQLPTTGFPAPQAEQQRSQCKADRHGRFRHRDGRELDVINVRTAVDSQFGAPAGETRNVLAPEVDGKEVRIWNRCPS